ncbi:MAG: hypothetical protein JXR48_05170 [Candidatus Delongbacteria bacterium]|nr:hypothetical protein [Candidatus Delongbacteria bacterium]
MLIPSDQIPQADNLIDVLRTVISVSQGSRTFQEIAQSIGKVERQGRYYRKAAEIIGLIITPSSNSSILTPLGQEFIRTGAVMTNPVFIQSVLNIRLFQRLIPFLESNNVNGLSRQGIIDFIIDVSDLERNSMAPRRVSSVVSWLEELNIIERRNERFFLLTATINNNVDLLNFTSIDEPILPRSTQLSEYETVQERSNSASETIITYRNQAALDRADNAHRRLVNLVAQRIKDAGQIPRFNQLIDLATRHDGNDYIFEMKSITDENARKQVRNGLSQLYEYQYLQNLPNSNLVLVIERNLPNTSRWMIDYLENDRNVSVIWDGDNNLYGTDLTRSRFEFLNLTPI